MKCSAPLCNESVNTGGGTPEGGNHRRGGPHRGPTRDTHRHIYRFFSSHRSLLCIYKYLKGDTQICKYVCFFPPTCGIYIYYVSIYTVKETHICVDISILLLPPLEYIYIYSVSLYTVKETHICVDMFVLLLSPAEIHLFYIYTYFKGDTDICGYLNFAVLPGRI